MTENMLFNSFAKGSLEMARAKGSNCVIYTRVSSKEQADKNLSLETQKKACNQYAERQGFNILADFGGTYESAQNDERKEFTAMLSYVKKSRAKVSHILVYSLERFSRNDNSIWLSNQLRKLGVEIVSVTQPIDTSNPSGQMQQKMLFLFGEFDNQLRKQKCMAGMKEMLLRGNWPTNPPMGYDSIRINGERRIVVNEKGKLLKMAFHWKADEGLSNESIRFRLRQKGLKLHKQRISEVFKNPFYCGLLTHNMLEGQVVDGNQEKLVSRDLFLRVNGIIEQHVQGYKVLEENDAIPLKRFLHCHTCGKLLRGYIVKKKNIYYYKCCTTGCCNNRSASVLNERFASILNYFNLNISADVINLLKTQMIATFNQLTKDQQDSSKQLQMRLIELNSKIGRLEERFIEEEINAELYHKYYSKYVEEKKEMEREIDQGSNEVSNLDKCVDLAVNFASRMRLKWLSGDYAVRQQIQFLLFPEGINYDRKTDGCRTTRINNVFLYLAYLQQIMTKKKRGIPELNLNYASLSSWVAGAGLEPTTFGL
jgi:site-specific DNA recombinase